MSSLFNSVPSRRLGGKAAALQELQSAGFRVPEFLVSPRDLLGAIRRLGLPLAVRSSASVEDQPRHSFAGLFRSFLNLRSLADVEAAVEACQGSLHCEAVAEYCDRHQVNQESLCMDFILQRMVQPELAGVAFSVNPVTGAEQVTVEACQGLADDLLSGERTPLPAEHVLLTQHLPRIESLARRLQQYFGVPQDVEFAIERGEIYVLQSRPITRINFAADVGEWTNAVFRDGGVSRDVCSPLMWSLYNFVWEDALKDFLREIRLLRSDFVAGRMFFGRPYWNLGAVKQCLAKLPGFVERDFDEDLSVEIDYQGDGRRTPINPITLIRAIPAILAIGRVLNQQPAAARRLLSDGPRIVAGYEAKPGDVMRAFRYLVETDFKRIETTYFRTIFAASLAKLDFTASFPEADYPALMAGLPELQHMQSLRELKAMLASGERDLAAGLSKVRHQSDLGMDVCYPRWDEDEDFVVRLVSNSSEPQYRDLQSAYREARAQTVGRIKASKRKDFENKLERLRELIWLREQLRDLSSQMYYLIRRYALAIASERGLGDDIFMMSFPEIFADHRANIPSRRAGYEGYRNFCAPNEIGKRVSVQFGHSSGKLCGIGASPGTVTGVAHVARSLKDTLSMQDGSILVCPYIEPSWIPALDRAAAVVTESGGMLSHAAVICREYGVPAVLSVRHAIERIQHGSSLLVNGENGYVESVN